MCVCGGGGAHKTSLGGRGEDSQDKFGGRGEDSQVWGVGGTTPDNKGGCWGVRGDHSSQVD